MKRAAAVTIWFWSHFGGTVQLAQLNKTLHSELERRAEYAMRYGIHAPRQWLSSTPLGLILHSSISSRVFQMRKSP